MLSNLKNFIYSLERMSWLTDDDGNKYSSNVAVTTGSGHLQQAGKNWLKDMLCHIKIPLLCGLIMELI